MFKNIPRHILTILTVASAALLLTAAATAYISPKYLHVLAFAGFAFPLLWVINLLFVVVNLLGRNWKRFALGLAATLATWGHWANCYQMNNLFGSDAPLKGTVTVMSFNTRMFDYYTWTGKTKVVEDVLEFVRKKNPDVVCFQEFFTFDKKEYYSENHIMARLNGYKYRHIEYNVISKNGKKFGQATFSKYPIVGQKQLDFKNTSNFSIQTDIVVGKHTFRVFNNHLESVRLNSKHYNFIDSINLKSDAERKAGIKEISSKLNTALTQRAYQAETIARHISNSPYPVIVCGDFNDTPVSYVYHTMLGNLNDAFHDAGKGMGGTYNGKLPSFRIDFIFHDPAFTATHFNTFDVNYSDHFPIMATILLDKQAK